MKNTLKISLKANEKIYVNGAVIKTDRRVSLEFLNDVQFLLENHVLQAKDASTPLRQLYFIAQVVLMDPGNAQPAREMFERSLRNLLGAFANPTILAGLKQIDALMKSGQVYEALKEIRGLYPLEEEILQRTISRPQEPTYKKAVGE